MKRCPPLWYRAAWAAVLVSLLAVSAYAQTGLQSGNIFGVVEANDGSVLPGVTVTLTGVGAPQVQVTDAQGRFRFINLSPASYTVKAELAGYGTATRSGVTVNIGRNAEVTIQLNPSVAQTITVTAEAPLLDTRRTGTGATVTEVELEQVPTARDPWVILQQVPGVLMDRINVGGNESGQQSGFVSKGVGSDQATYSVDGVNTTDMIATGGSSAYYDFGSFEEIQVATGGTDPRVQSPGAQINMVTKRGTNDLTGSARYYMADGQWQAEATPPDEATAYLRRANEIDQNNEWGFDIGGPIIRDRLWLWGAYADQQVDLLVAWPTAAELAAVGLGDRDPEVRFTDKTSLETINAKLNAQVTRNNSAVLFYYDNQKTKQGRNASPTRPPETTWNQGGFGPAGTYKLEDTHIFNSNFYLTGLYSKVNGGFGLWANAGANCEDMDCVVENAKNGSWVIDLASLTNRNTFVSVQGERPQEQLRLDGSAFFNTGALSHELKFGFGYRSAGAEGLTVYPNNQLILDYTNLGYPQLGLTYFYAIGPYDYEYQYNDIYVGDTMLWGNLTLQAGLRFDNQKGMAGDQTGPANPLVAPYLPAVSVKGSDIEEMEWDTISPRLGLTYALGSEKRTLLRGAYNRYVGQLGSNSSGYSGTIPAYYRYIAFYSFDANNNDIITQDEILFEYGIYGRPVGFDPENPTDTRMRRIDPDIEAPTTDEFILGFEHELLRDFVVSLNYTHRDLDNFIWTQFEKTRGAGDFITRADYIPTRGIYPGTANPTITNLCDQDRNPATPDSNCTPEVDPYAITVYSLRPGVEPKYGVLRNRPGYSQTYDGLELGLVKRMANRWMLRGNFSWNDWVQNVDEESIIDPTPLRTAYGCSVCDGADVVQGSGTISGAKGAVWINSEWAVNLAGVYQIPVIETNFGMNFTMRQGYPMLYAHPVYVTEDVLGSPNRFIARNVLLSDVTEHRLPNPYSLDLRLAKDFRFRGVGLELSVDAFNVTNNRPELQRNTDLRSRSNQRRNRTASFIRELQSPRIFRVGARLTF
jgi:Carboxypeptidase regulatory-like domain/TonB-dependent Receptor Plug Domain